MTVKRAFVIRVPRRPFWTDEKWRRTYLAHIRKVASSRGYRGRVRFAREHGVPGQQHVIRVEVLP